MDFVCMYKCGSGNPQNPGSRRCTASRCKKWQFEERHATHSAPNPVAAPNAPHAEVTSCFVVKEVIGVSMCLEKICDQEQRCGRKIHDDEICYQVRGKFAKSKDEPDDDMLPDTRWVKLASLVDNNLDEEACELLDTLIRNLFKVAKVAEAAA